MLQVLNLKKDFGSLKAVDGLNFILESGHIYAFVGPNGAGKTTTMRMIATLEMPTSGDILVDGQSIFEHTYEIRRKIGYMPDHFGIYNNLTVRDYLEFYARAYQLPRQSRNRTIADVIEFTGLQSMQEMLVPTLSKGMMQRLNMGRGLLNNASVLVLDEPAAGLDPRARIELRYLLKALAAQGKTIFVSSHILSELAEMCDAMLIIDKGRQIVFGTVDEIQSRMQGLSEIHVKLVPGSGQAERLEQWLLAHPAVTAIVTAETDAIRFSTAAAREETSMLLAAMVNEKFPVLEFRPITLTMEDVFMQITEGELA
jgi:ABC-2 type transport system ATP-binding protein